MHVESQLSDLLKYLIDKGEQVELKGIGVFFLEYNDPKEENIIDTLSPPIRRITFIQDSGSEVELPALAYSYRLITDSERSYLTELIKAKAEELSKTESTFIDGLGFIRKSDGKKNWEDSQNLQAGIGSFLPNVRLQHKVEIKDPVANEMKDRVDEMITPTSMKGQRIKIDDSGNSWFQFLIPVILLLAGIAFMAIVFKFCYGEKPDMLKEDRSYPIGTISDKNQLDNAQTLGINSIDSVESSPIFTNPILNKYKHVLTQEIIDDGCKITVGSFKNKRNAVAMTERLNQDGYAATLLEFEGGTRVLIKFKCEEYDLVEYLNIIRNEVSPSAWYYQPDFDPDEQN